MIGGGDSGRLWISSGASTFQPVQVLLVRGFANRAEASQEVGGFEALVPVEARLIAVRCQGDGEQEPGVDDVIDDDLGVRGDLAENVLVRVVGAVRPVHDEDPVSPRFEFEPFEGAREAVRSPPLGEFFGVLKGGEDLLRRKRQQTLGGQCGFRIVEAVHGFCSW